MSTISLPFSRLKVMLLLTAIVLSTGLMGCKPAPEQTDTDNPGQLTAEMNQQSNRQGETANQDMVTMHTTKGEVQVPANPNPVVVYDMTLLQNLAALEVPVQGIPEIERLKSSGMDFNTDSQVVGTLFEPDMEALNAMQPQAILIGGRMSSKYKELSSMAPTLDLSIDTNNSYESSKQQLADLGKLFDKTDKAEALQQDIDNAVAEAKAAAEGKGNALIVMVNGNKLSVFGDNSRFGFIHTNFGIPKADQNINNSTHGQPASFEYIKKINPDWLFVLDRTSALGKEGAGAKTVLDNPLVHQTKAWQNDHILYLSPDAYLAYGGYNQWIKDANLVIDNFAQASKVDAP